jgi:NitT/TauT family transport system substrate-binding protein
MRHGWRLLLLSAFSLVAAHAPAVAQQGTTLRVGHFPNITHVQALVARAFERQGRPWFGERLGPGVKIEWYTYNAGPSAMEAIFAKSLDLTYVGPNPALNAYARSRGDEVRVIGGAVNGGSALVVQGDSTLTKPADFKGKRIATPQFGNTQDVAARAWLVAGGLRITQTGGDAQVLPTSNPDQLSLFQGKQLDAVWTVEPWWRRRTRSPPCSSPAPASWKRTGISPSASWPPIASSRIGSGRTRTRRSVSPARNCRPPSASTCRRSSSRRPGAA